MGEEGAFEVMGPAPIIILREVRWDDVQILVDHRNQWETRRWLEDCDKITLEGQRSWFDLSSHKYRIATVDGEAIGLVRLNFSQVGGDAEVGCDIFSKHRGRGLGRATFEATLKRARDLGAKTASLWVFCENERAVSIYMSALFSWDLSSPVKTFLRPDEEHGKPTPRQYARMCKVL